jgi:hypothetical protein
MTNTNSVFPASAPSHAPTSRHLGARLVVAFALVFAACARPETDSVTVPLTGALTATLVNAGTGQPIAGFDPIANGATITLSALPTRSLSIRANAASVGSVKFTWDTSYTHGESVAPYSFCGDGSPTSYTPCPQLNVIGQHSLTVAAYSGSGQTGTVQGTITVNVTIRESGSSPPDAAADTAPPADTASPTDTGSPSGPAVQSFTLINADNAQPIAGHDPLVNGSTITLSALPTQNLSVRANAAGVGSVQLAIDGTTPRVESVAPYSLCGDSTSSYTPCPQLNAAGNHSLTARASTGSGFTGTQGPPLTITFIVKANAADAGAGVDAGADSGAGGGGGLPKFPLVVSSSGRYLQDQTGKPFRVHGDTAWGLINELDLAGVRFYLDDRKAKGVNALIMQASNPDKNGDNLESVAPAARGAGMAKPYLRNINGGTWTGVLQNHDAALDSPNDVYWNWVDTVLQEMAARGIVAVIDHLYMGYNFGENAWWQDLHKPYNTQTVCYNFGRYLGLRWKNHPNVIVKLGTDMFPISGSEDSARFLKILDGMRDAGFNGLVTAHYKRSSDARDYPDYASRIKFNSVYPGIGAGSYGPPYGRMRLAYAKTPAMPTANVEAVYEGDPQGAGPSRVQLRSYGWWSVTSGGGYFFGQRRVEAFERSGGVEIWRNYLATAPTLDHQRMGVFLDSLPWHLLVPDGLGSIGTLVTAGAGSYQSMGAVGSNDGTNGLDRVTAAATPDRSTLIAYVPHAHTGTVTIDMTKMRGTTVQRWFDPATGNYQSAGPNLPNTGTRAFTPPAARGDGSKDWVLRLDAP